MVLENENYREETNLIDGQVITDFKDQILVSKNDTIDEYMKPIFHKPEFLRTPSDCRKTLLKHIPIVLQTNIGINVTSLE